MTVTVRFAPSPTGLLHIGGARTALFNWLFARHHGGTFRLRIEDTDRVRSTKESIKAIVDGLKWLNLNWDGEIVFQSARAKRHAEIAHELLARGHAYYCYCTPEELEAMRTKAVAEKRSVRYDGTWRDRDPIEAPLNISPVIRLRTEQESKTTIHDLVQGKVTVANSQLDDLIILRANGTPTYNLSVVVDDHDMDITHVIRGDDHLNNAFRQAQIYRALDWTLPEFAHIPLIHDASGTKMSKRRGTVAMDDYRALGYLPEAMSNYLLRLGWSHGNDEIISTDQAIEWFDIDDVNRGAARFDQAKLDNVNAHYIRKARDDSSLVELVAQHLETKLGCSLSNMDRSRLLRAMPVIKPRAKTIVELAERSLFCITSKPISISSDAMKFITADGRLLLKELALILAPINWNMTATASCLYDFANSKGIKIGVIGREIRSALTGSPTSPGIFEVMEILGRDETLARLKDAAEFSK